MITPEPEWIKICSACREPWEGHLRHAQDIYNLKRYAAMESDEQVPDPWHFISEETKAELITLEICIKMLKARNQGPSGPVGPMGAPGRDGGPPVVYGDAYPWPDNPPTAESAPDTSWINMENIRKHKEQ